MQVSSVGGITLPPSLPQLVLLASNSKYYECPDAQHQTFHPANDGESPLHCKHGVGTRAFEKPIPPWDPLLSELAALVSETFSASKQDGQKYDKWLAKRHVSGIIPQVSIVNKLGN